MPHLSAYVISARLRDVRQRKVQGSMSLQASRIDNPLVSVLLVLRIETKERQEQLSRTCTLYSQYAVASIPLTRYGKKDARGVLADATPVPIMQARFWLCEWSVRPRYLFARYFHTTLAIGTDWQLRMACSPQSFPEKASNLGSTPKVLGRDMHKAQAQ
jgi:hypothetical protein